MFSENYYNGKKIINRECRFATFVPPPNYSDPDLHVVKEILHLEDNTRVPNLRHIYDYKRSFHIVKKGQRTFTQYIDYVEGSSVNMLTSWSDTITFLSSFSISEVSSRPMDSIAIICLLQTSLV